MELMSSLLLCAIVTLLPQSLGRSNIKLPQKSDVNHTAVIKKRPLLGKNIIVNVHSPPVYSKVSDLQSVFMDPACRGCYICMERSIKAHRVHNKMGIMNNNIESLQAEYILQNKAKRDKRKTNIDKVASKQDTKGKKSKSRKNNKSVTIIKYNDKNKVYALKIKETYTNIIGRQNTTKMGSTCQVYRVEKSSPCESHEADLILSVSQNKINKKGKKEQNKSNSNVAVVKETVVAPEFRKRQIDNSQVPEQIMPSIEEIY